MNLLDAHCHLHHLPRDGRDGVIDTLTGIGCAGEVVNGTAPDDWDAVAAFADARFRVHRAYGVHPWYLDHVPEDRDWLADLRGRLDADPAATIGEIGIDHARPESEHERAEQAFLVQLDEAAVRNRPCTVHCVRVHDRLWHLIEKRAVPKRGWLLHGWSGPSHLVRKFADRGAYFSYSACTLARKKPAASLAETPLDRVLIETDAPYMPPPPANRRYELADASGQSINHPANLVVAYERAAGLLGVSVDALAQRVAENFTRLFGPGG